MEQRPTYWGYFINLLLFIIGIQIGNALPDFDQRLPFLVHRSLLTHGPLFPLLLFVLVRKNVAPAPRWFAMGVCLAVSIHLCFDLFPRRWWGFALVWVPLYGRTDALFSWFWIGAGCLVCLYLALLLVRRAYEIMLGALGLAGTFFSSGVDEPGIVAPLFALLVASVAAIALPSKAGAMLRRMASHPPDDS